MERELRIFEMNDAANPMSLARSRLLQGCLPPEYAATRARRAISLKTVSHSSDNLWSFVMLPDTPAVSGLSSLLVLLYRVGAGLDGCYQQRVTVDATRSDPPTPRARGAARAVQRQEKERVARAKERRIRRWEHLEQYNEEYRLREQWGLSPPLAPANSSLEEEEEEGSDGGCAAPERWDPPPPSRRAAEVVADLVLMAGAEASVVGSSTEVPAGATSAPTGATEAPPSPRGRGSGASPT
jgi:hypothetical protein